MLDFQLLFEKSPLRLAVLAPDRRIEAVTDAYLADAGKTRAEVLGRDAIESLGPSALCGLPHDLRSADCSTVGPVHRQGERYCRALDLPVKDGDGRVAHMLHAVEDVTELMALRDSLSEVAQFALFIKSVKDYAMFLLDPAGRVTSWNLGAERLKGYTEAEAIGKPYREFFEPSDVEAGRPGALMAKARSDGSANETGWRVRKDGSRFLADATLTALRSPRGELVGFAKVTRDVTERQRLEDELRASESRFHALFRNSQEAILLAEPQGAILEANAAACGLFGTNALRGAPIASVFAPEDPRLAAARHARASQGWFRGPLTFVRHDASRFEGEVTASDFPGVDGAPQVSVIVRDVTDRLRAEAAVADLAGIVTASVDAIFTVKPGALTVSSWNAGAERLFGYAPDEVIGRSACHFVPDDRREEALDALAQAGEGRSVGPYETVRRRKDGRLIDVSICVFAVRDGQGRITSYSAIVRDISALKEREARFRALLEAAPDATVVADAEGRIVQLNAQTERMFGYDREALTGRSIDILLPDRERAAHPAKRASWAAAPRTRAMGADVELFAQRRDGTTFPVDVGLSPLETPEGTLTIAAIRDISERKRWMEEVAMRTAELRNAQELHSLKDHFLSTLSHEMKTPLAMVQGYAELLEERYPHDELAAGVMAGARRLTSHINKMLDYSALLGRTMPLYPQAVSLDEFVANATAIVGDAYRDKRVALEPDVDPATPAIDADPRRVSQILTELLDNALRFTPPGGRAGVRVGPVADAVRIEVWDTGTGIPVDHQAGVWEPFAQVEIGDAHRTGGLGLGLTIVRELARLHGGRTWMESEPGRGSRFLVELPAPRPA